MIADFAKTCENTNATDALRVATAFFEMWAKLKEREATDLNYKPTEEERMAGIESLSGLGQELTLYALADGDATKYEAVYQLPWAYVHINRRDNLHINKYMKRLSDIRNKPKSK